MPTPSPMASSPRKIAVTGASGFVGKHLVPALLARGHEVVAMSRSPRAESAPRLRWTTYDPTSAESIRAAIDGSDAVIHLAGHGVFEGRWTAANMARIRDSRVGATALLVKGLEACRRRPTVLASASAIGFYGARPPDEDLDESNAPGVDFLAEVCAGWEREARGAERLGVRVATVRTGIVLGRGGGPLAKMVTPMKLFLGGPIGNGRQAMSWIHVDDLSALYAAVVEGDGWSGPVNATAPGVVSNREFAKALGKALHRPSFLPTPAFALRIVLGKVVAILSTGQRVLPKAAIARGFHFRFPALDGALADLLG